MALLDHPVPLNERVYVQEDGRQMARCTKCPKGNDLHEWSAFSISQQTGKPYSRCKKCAAADRKAYVERIKQDPEKLAAFRADQKAAIKMWQKAHPERVAAAKKKYNAAHPEKVREQHRNSRKKRMAKIKADPVLHQEYLENKRIKYRMQKEKLGETLTREGRSYKVNRRPEPKVTVPVEPIHGWLYPKVKNGSVNLTQLANAIGLDRSKMDQIMQKRYNTVLVSTVDKILVHLNGPPLRSLYPDA
jgi:hypothetical protein